MADPTSPVPDTAPRRAVRDLADDYVHRLAALDPLVAEDLGFAEGRDRLPDLSPAGQEAVDALDRDTLDRLAAVTGGTTPTDPDERRCARLLDERLRARLAVSASGEHLRDVQDTFGPVQAMRVIFTLMPLDTDEDWRTVAARMAALPDALRGYRESLADGARRGLFAAPRQVRHVADQFDGWVRASDGRGWFSGFTDGAAAGDRTLRSELDTAAAGAAEALAGLRDWLRTDYLPGAADTPDGVGDERYRLASRYWNGADIDPVEVNEWGWSEFRRLRAEMAVEAERVLPGADASAAMAHLDAHGDVVEGGERARDRLQAMMDATVAELGRTHFELADPIRRVEARLAPAGSAAAPYYTSPSLDFARPGRTWLPRTPDDRYPMWDLTTTWYHEGVPGHHLQIAQWVLRAGELSTFQATVGGVSANLEGWALYAELLMDELGHHTDPGTRLGYLNGQMLRAVRVVIDTGMHLSLPIPADSPVGAGERWTAELGREFYGRHVGGGGDAMAGSELVRYLGGPGQAIGYKLGQRAWLQGRENARRAHEERGAAFDVKSWHMTALSQGSLGLDDLVGELGAIRT